MEPKDELLAKLKAIEAETKATRAEPELQPVSPPTSSSSVEATPQINTEEFLAKLDALDQATRPTPPPPPTVTPTPLSTLRKSAPTSQPASSPLASAHSSSPPPKTQPSRQNTPAKQSNPGSNSHLPPQTAAIPVAKTTQPYIGISNVIERLKQFTQEQLAAHAAQNQAKAQQAQDIARAQAWLDDLDPLSDDGFWFEQFAERYESRLQAALDFLNPEGSK